MSRNHNEVRQKPQRAKDSDVPALLWLRAFPGQPDQVREARHWIENVLPRCEPRDDLVMIASELCSNAIAHTRSGSPGGQFTVHLAWSTASVRLTVEDQGSDKPPAAVLATLHSEHGRGLSIVRELAAAWGFTGSQACRRLWADVPWLSQNGPGLISPRGAMPTTEAVRKLHLACPGITIGYDGTPPAQHRLPCRQPAAPKLPRGTDRAGQQSPPAERTTPMTSDINDVTAEAWAGRIQALDDDERARRLEAVTVLLGNPDQISDGLESELDILRTQLTRQLA